ncbi:unnamed protein product [Trichogramma brassicae]|uniref:Cadherin domain-containing protein n=1 Tax=Trichogramma brassicae TaxID=86971 RepID=A0A6H5HWZ1_9HYME|nr:unnamed protein product [Trichogramma brassicae]
MNFFANHGMFKKLADVEKSWHDDEKFARELKNITIEDSDTSPSLYDLIRSRRVQAELAYADYLKFAHSKKLEYLSDKQHRTRQQRQRAELPSPGLLVRRGGERGARRQGRPGAGPGRRRAGPQQPDHLRPRLGLGQRRVLAESEHGRVHPHGQSRLRAAEAPKERVRARVQHYILVVQATDSGNPALSSTVTCYCNVVDVNDNAPYFEAGPRSAEIVENGTVGAAVLALRALDADSGPNGRVTYSIVSGDDDEDFGIAANGTLYTRRPLDRESKTVYNLMVQAADSPKAPAKALSTSVQITINVLDINDESPRFVSSNRTSIPENAAPNSVVMIVKAQDRDEGRNGYVEYSLEDAADASPLPFSLGSVDGVLRVSGQLDRELRANYTLRIRARDRGEPSRWSRQSLLVLVLDENDNAPVFDARPYSVSVAENASIGASVLKVSASDRDEAGSPYGRVRYSIVSGDPNRDFAISEDSGVIRVAKRLDYERQARYRLQLRAEDCPAEREDVKYDLTELVVNLLDVNDNAPCFVDSPYLAQVMENQVPAPLDGAGGGGYVARFEARDADGDQVSYYLKEGDPSLFRLNSSTGELALLRSLDRELKSEYTLTLVAMDSETLLCKFQ